MVKSHSCTEGFLMFGSNAPTLGATLAGWVGENKAAEGFTLGPGTATGNPCEMRVTFVPLRTPLGSTHPNVVVAVATGFFVTGSVAVPIFVWQFSRNPGTLPAIAVTWNVERVSKSHE